MIVRIRAALAVIIPPMKSSIVTPRVLRWLENGRPARVLNLFDEVCNLADDTGDVISLVTARVGPGPFSMIVDGTFTNNLDARMPVAVDPHTQTLTIGPLTITSKRAAVWNPKPEWRILAKDASLNLTLPPMLETEIVEPLLQLLGGIKHGSTAECRSGAYRLAGLGQGLTPAGDDVLIGILYGLWVWYPREEWMRLIVETAVPRTTTLSAAFLRAAADGEATIHWHNLVNGRMNAMNQILAIGSTSGRDAWAGFTYLGRHFRN